MESDQFSGNSSASGTLQHFRALASGLEFFYQSAQSIALILPNCCQQLMLPGNFTDLLQHWQSMVDNYICLNVFDNMRPKFSL